MDCSCDPWSWVTVPGLCCEAQGGCLATLHLSTEVPLFMPYRLENWNFNSENPH